MLLNVTKTVTTKNGVHFREEYKNYNIVTDLIISPNNYMLQADQYMAIA